MSIKEALHYLRHNGLGGEKIISYAKITSCECMKRCLIMFGPVVGGMPCYSANFNQFWRKSGRFQGGHCVTFVGYNTEGFIMRNSWGTSWGKNGYLTIPYEEFEDSCFEAWTVTI